MGKHINTFEKGMNKDFDPVFQPDGTYRNLVNCNLISQDGRNFSIKDCLGNTLIFTLNRRYLTNTSTFDVLPTAIDLISFPDKLIVLSTNDETDEGGYGEIGIIKYMPYGEGIQPLSETGQSHAGYTPLYHSVDLKFTKVHRIEGFAMPENDLIQRIYFSDNNDEPKVFNVADPIYTTYIASGSLSATADEKYMILQGAITYNGNNYGPGLPNGNIITTTGGIQTYTNLTGSITKVIKNVASNLLKWTPDRLLGGMYFKEFGTGGVICGDKFYFYRLGLNSSYTTSWSYPSSPVHVGIIDTSNPSGIKYHGYEGGGNSNETVKSSYSVKMTIDNIDPNFDFIELACAEFDQLVEIPRQITIVDRQSITGSSMVLEHNGLNNYGVLTLSDITLFSASILKVKTLTTEKNYNIIGNITERKELDVSFSGVTIQSFEYPMNVFYNNDNCANFGINNIIYNDVSPLSGTNPSSGSIAPRTRWLVISGGTVTYNAVVYSAGQIFTGIAGVTTYSTTGTPIIRPCTTKNRYQPVGTTDRRENAIELLGDACFWDYKSAAVHEHNTGYWSDETYRLGIEFEDLKGNLFYVRWIGDYRMPNALSKGGILIKDTYNSNDMYSVNPSGLKIGNIRIPAEIVGKVKGFRIVRAKRDARIVTQGLVVQCSQESVNLTIHPTSWIYPFSDNRLIANKTYSYICPDELIDSPMPSNFGIVGDSLETVSWFNPLSYNNLQVKSAGGYEQLVSKLIDTLTDDPLIESKKISFFGSVNEDQEINLNNGFVFDNNTQLFLGAIDATCLSVPGFISLSALQNNGGKKNVIQLEEDFAMYSNSGVYTDLYCGSAASASPIKVLMNYTNNNNNQYGGTSEAALANTVYISTGHFQPINDIVISETCNTGDPTNYDYLQFDEVEVFGGDCYVNFVDYGYGLFNDTNTFSYGWTFPCEGNANYALRNGRKVSKNAMYFTGNYPAGSPNPYTDSIVFKEPMTGNVRLEGYSYNKGYNTQGTAFAEPALPANFINTNQFPFRIRFAGPKFLGELQDSFRTFLINDRYDMPGNYGRINNIKVRDGHVLIWQDLATNTVPVLERQLLSGADGSVSSIGTGGVVDRNDPITSFFGNQHQWSLIETEYGFAWFDMRRKTYMIFSFEGGGLIKESQIGGLSGFFNEAFLEVDGASSVISNDLLNDPTFALSSDRPLMGVGITGVYDPKFKMTYMTFKFYGRKGVPGFNGMTPATVKGTMYKDFTIGYAHTDKIRAFIGFYDWFPTIAHQHNQIVLSCNNPKNTTQYLPANGNYTLYSFVVGETYALNDIEYICIKDVTLNGDADRLPGYGGSIYWTPINDQSQLWVHNQPKLLGQNPAPDYIYDSFFGRVVDNTVEIIVNPKTDNAFEVTNMEQMTPENVNYTSVFTEAGSQTAADISITSTDRNYRYIFDRITHNLPLSKTGRIVKNYLKMRFVKKNWSGDFTVTPKIKILQYITNFFTEKR